MKLKTSRKGWPGCAKLGSKVIISGVGWLEDGGWFGTDTRQGPRLSIRIDIWILPSDTETSAATPLVQVKDSY